MTEILPLVLYFPTEQVTCIDSQTWMPYKPDRKSMIKSSPNNKAGNAQLNALSFT